MSKIPIKLEKRGEGKYAFVTITDDFKRTEEVEKPALKKLYVENINQLRNVMEQLGTINKDIEKLGIVEDDELKHFVELANKAAKYNEYQKKIDARTNMLNFIEDLKHQKEDIEKVAPEFRRIKM